MGLNTYKHIESWDTAEPLFILTKSYVNKFS